MKNKLFLLAILVAFTAASCKNEETKKPEEAVAAPVKENFSVELQVSAEKDDNFAVYYTEDKTINFTGEQAAWTGIKGNNVDQTVVVDLKEEVLPTDIRIDFGINKDQGDVVLKHFKLSYAGKTFEAKGSDFLKYFIKNDAVQTKIDEAAGTITFLKNPKGFSPPFYYPHQAILDEIAKITG